MKLIFKVLFVILVVIWLYNTKTRIDRIELELESVKSNCDLHKNKISQLETKIEYDAKVIENLNFKVEQSKKAFEVHNARIALLGILFNENFASLGNNFIFIETNWKITKMPTQLMMTRSDSQYIIENHLDKEANIKKQTTYPPNCIK